MAASLTYPPSSVTIYVPRTCDSVRAQEILKELRSVCIEYVSGYDLHPRQLDDELDSLEIIIDAWVDYQCTGE